MKINQMRRIDLYVGGVICLALELVERIKRIFPSGADSVSIPKRILVTKYLGMGSILLATPMLKALKNRFPGCKIVLLTFESNAEFARQLPLIDEVLYLRTSSFSFFAWDLLRSLLHIRREKFDVVLDLEFFARFSTIVSYLCGARMRIGYYLPKLWRGDLLTHHVHFNPYRHVTEVFSAQLKPLGIDVNDLSLASPIIDNTKLSSVRSILEENGVHDNDGIISVNVNASDLSQERRWPREKFVELIKYIAENKAKAKIVLVGSRGESGYVRGVYEALPDSVKEHVVDLSGRLDIKEFIALLKISALFITNDSGPLHIASAIGTQTVSFFGPESPSLYGSVGDNNITFYAGIYCSPCLNVYNAKTAMCNGDNRCMKEITVAEVKNALVDKGLIA